MLSLFPFREANFTSFAQAYENFFNCQRDDFRKDFFHAYVMWSALCWVEEASRPIAWGSVSMTVPAEMSETPLSWCEIECSIGHQGADLESFLQQVEPTWMRFYKFVWVFHA